MEPDSTGNLRGIAIFSFYLTTCASLTILILRDLYLQARQRDVKYYNAEQKSKYWHRIQLFGALAAVSLSITWFYMFSFFSFSYRAWAFENGVMLPHGVSDALYVQHGRQLRLGAWLKDVQLFREAWEVVLETSPRLFWSQPIFFITAAWSTFLGIETHRRKIPHAWAYMVLGQIVAISFAQNLFFLAMLLFPVQPKTQTTKDQAKSVNWTASRGFYIACVLTTFASVCAIPYVTGTSAFLYVLLLPHVVLLVPCFLHAVVPASWGIEHKTLSAANQYIRSVYELTFTVAFYCQVKAAADAYFFPSENVHSHKDTDLHLINKAPAPFGSNFAMIDQALYDHPAVSSVGWDALLCTLSYLCWKTTKQDSVASVAQ